MKEAIEFSERLALRGKFPTNAGRGPRMGRTGRVCANERCATVLSVYNTGDRCWEHTAASPYLLNVRRFRANKQPA